jgi:hypothetical protein
MTMHTSLYVQALSPRIRDPNVRNSIGVLLLQDTDAQLPPSVAPYFITKHKEPSMTFSSM